MAGLHDARFSVLVGLFSVAIPVATRRQALAVKGTNWGCVKASASSAGTLWRCLAGLVTDSPFRTPPCTGVHRRAS